MKYGYDDTISADHAHAWMCQNGFDDPVIRDTHIERFLEMPDKASHMFVAMLIIEQCAETPQNFTDVYGEVRDMARSMQPKAKLGTPASAVSIIEKVHQAREEDFDEDTVLNRWMGYLPVR